ncbi:MAG: uracil-DNA glycosylase [Candidatus ainarchaeum sp.]|nr:uracil-DNA glycosylase [Candidatus ainarchaeum sp.]
MSDLNDSKKLANFKIDFINHAKKSELYKNIIETNGNIVFGKGSDSPKIVFIGEAPGNNENKIGLPFIGRSGKLLDNWIKHMGLNDQDYSVINVVPIIPLKDGLIRAPTENEINYFLPFTKKYLELLNPKIIVLLGRSAASIFDKTLSVGQMKDYENRKIIFIYHPSFYLRRGQNGLEDANKLKLILDSLK